MILGRLGLPEPPVLQKVMTLGGRPNLLHAHPASLYPLHMTHSCLCIVSTYFTRMQSIECMTSENLSEAKSGCRLALMGMALK